MQTITSLGALLFVASFTAAIPTNEVRSGSLAPRYTGGTCGVHVVQEQKNDIGNSEYLFTVTIYDGAQAEQGYFNQVPIATDETVNFNTPLPFPLAITAGAVDDDPVGFSYDGYDWTSSTGCSLGGYDGGSRQMDCGFGC